MLRVLLVAVVSFATLSCTAQDDLQRRFPPPDGSVRTPIERGSFAHYLRHLPLKPRGTKVLLHTGDPKPRQDVHAAVVDLPLGTRDLQQCADAIIRLRASHLRAAGRDQDIAFELTNGFKVPWSRWAQGERVRVSGNVCAWSSGGTPDSSDAAFERYLEFVFTYAGTLSLARELVPASQLPLSPGDVFVRGGSPGHAMLVLDVARHADGRHAFLLGQSYMPAQDFHVVRNPASASGDAWFIMDAGEQLVTPEWTFEWGERKRWP